MKNIENNSLNGWLILDKPSGITSNKALAVVKSILKVKKDTQEKDLLELIKKDQIIEKYLAKKDIKKVIFVKNRLMNILIND